MFKPKTKAKVTNLPKKGKAMTTPTQDKTTTSPNVLGAQHPIPETVDPLLVEILSRPREHNSITELDFKSWLITKLNELGHKPTLKSEGAIHVEIRLPGGQPPSTLFSCHIDTVDRGVVTETSRKTLDYDANFGIIMLGKDNKVGSCLGADDGAGVWILLKMIEAKVPGGYIFNRGEELGGISAKAIARNDGDWLAQYQVAVAFDRPRTNEVITHQRGRRTCSDKFGAALVKALNVSNPEFDYETSDTGVYTDTADFAGVIPECTNIGVGYTSQHGTSEVQDYAHLHALMQSCLKINWESLPADRDPKAVEYTPPKTAKWSASTPKWSSGSLWDGANGMDDTFGYDDFDSYYKKKAAPAKPAPSTPELRVEDEILTNGSVGDWVDIAMAEPEMTVELLLAAAAEIVGLRAQIAALKRVISSTANA